MTDKRQDPSKKKSCTHDNTVESTAPQTALARGLRKAGSPSLTNALSLLDAAHWLGELLACLHGDGGHYQDAHGMVKATQDAISAHYATIAALDALRAERDRYRAALARIGGQGAHPARDSALAALEKADKEHA